MTKRDREIGEAITHELEWDARIGSNSIDVQVVLGAVVLTGTIGSWAERWAAQEAALRVDGVREVSNRIEVELPRAARRSDVELAQSVRSALAWDVLVPKDRIRSSVNGGQVILEGQVDVCAQRDDAERAVRNIVGIRRLLNRIVVMPLVGEDHGVRTSLEGALERRAACRARRIDLDVHDGKVILSGVVHSWAERQCVVGAAKGTRGIRSVDDRLLVEPLR